MWWSISGCLGKKSRNNALDNDINKSFIKWFGDSSITGPKESYFDLAKDIYDWKIKPNCF